MTKAFKTTLGVAAGILVTSFMLCLVVLALHVVIIGAFTIYHLLELH